MKNKDFWVSVMMRFFVCTTCIGIAMGVLGIIFLPEQKFGYEAYLMPPIMAVLTLTSGVITHSDKVLSRRQMVVKNLLELLWIELIVYGINRLGGGKLEWQVQVSVALSVVIIYVTVCGVLWINDSRSAREFNTQLRKLQEQNTENEKSA